MNSDVIMDIFTSGLVLIPIFIMAMPDWSAKVLPSSGGKLQLLSFPMTIYLIFIAGLGSNFIGQFVVCISLVYFFYLYAAALTCLQQNQSTQNSKYNKNLKSDS